MYNQIVDFKNYQFILRTYRFRFFIRFFTNLIAILKNKKIILIFGMSRAGTSMLAQLLSQSPSSYYLHEPEAELMKYRFGGDWANKTKAFWDFVYSESQKDFKIHVLTCIALKAILLADKSIQTICIKPISVLDSMPEVSNAIKFSKILYISRHPAGRTESIMRQLVRDTNIPIVSLERLESLGKDWGSMNKKVQKWFEHHPAWQWIFFETLTNNPIVEFKELYGKLGLTWDETIQREIEKRTTGKDGDFYEVQRDASKQADKWRQALTGEQVEAIRRGTLPFKTNLYEGF